MKDPKYVIEMIKSENQHRMEMERYAEERRQMRRGKGGKYGGAASLIGFSIIAFLISWKVGLVLFIIGCITFYYRYKASI